MNISIELSEKTRTKIPDFGILTKVNGQFVRIGHLQFLEMYKLPDTNCIPTKLCTFGMQLEPSELELIIDKMKEAGFDNDTIIVQLQQLLKLVSQKYQVKQMTVKSYPFCKIQLLTPKQLGYINKLFNLNIDYKGYEIFMKTILSPEILQPLFLAEGVLDVPPMVFGNETQQQNNSDKLILQLVNKK